MNAPTDETIMYLVARKSLRMSAGKLAAQCGHAVMLMMRDSMLRGVLIDEERRHVMHDWLNGVYAKVVLGASEKDWAKLKSMPHLHYTVTDLGRTEVQTNSETVVGFWPMRKDDVPKELTRLQLLKAALPDSLSLVVEAFGAEFGTEFVARNHNAFDETLVHDLAAAVLAWKERHAAESMRGPNGSGASSAEGA